MAIHCDGIDVNAMMEEIETFYIDFIGNNDKKLELLLDTSGFSYPCRIETDSTRLRQIITNLMNNAVKFTNFGYIRFGYRMSEDQQEIIFFVEDTGIGISKENQQIIFDRFKQGYDHVKQTKYRGIGLGLSISHNLVKLMGGRIWLESEESAGSTFYFSLPLEYQESEKDAEEFADNQTSRTPLQPA
jgi:signal transduction histidine kinase